MGEPAGVDDGVGLRATAPASRARADDARHDAAAVRVARPPSRRARHLAQVARRLVGTAPTSGSLHRWPFHAWVRQRIHAADAATPSRRPARNAQNAVGTRSAGRRPARETRRAGAEESETYERLPGMKPHERVSRSVASRSAPDNGPARYARVPAIRGVRPVNSDGASPAVWPAGSGRPGGTRSGRLEHNRVLTLRVGDVESHLTVVAWQRTT